MKEKKMVDFVFEGDFSPKNIQHILKLVGDRTGISKFLSVPFLTLEENETLTMSTRGQSGVEIVISSGFINLVSRYFQWLCFSINGIADEEFNEAYGIMGPFGENIKELAEKLSRDVNGPMSYISQEEIPFLCDRLYMGHALGTLAFQYLFFHEIGHHYLGHIAIKSRRNITFLESQIMERDADVYASIFMGLSSGLLGRPPFQQFKWKSRSIENRFGPGSSGLYLAAYSVNSLFQLKGDKNWSINNGGSKTHPPDILRKLMISENIISSDEKNNISTEELLVMSARDARRHVGAFTSGLSADVLREEDRIPLEEYHSVLNRGLVALRAEAQSLVDWKIPWGDE